MLPGKYLKNQKPGNILSMSLPPAWNAHPTPLRSLRLTSSLASGGSSHTAWFLVPRRPLCEGKLLMCLQVPHRVIIKLNKSIHRPVAGTQWALPAPGAISSQLSCIKQKCAQLSWPSPFFFFYPTELIISCFPSQRQTYRFPATTQAPRNTA